VPGSSKKIAVARKSPLENAASQTWRYSSSGDFAYRIASLVAFNAANVRAMFVSNTVSSPLAILANPGNLRDWRLNGRYEPEQVTIQSKCPANEEGKNSEELR